MEGEKAAAKEVTMEELTEIVLASKLVRVKVAT
jgi:hypothetical protein